MSQGKMYLRNITFNETFGSELNKAAKNSFSLEKSLVRGIKDNDASKIVGPSEVGGSVENAELYDEVQEMAAVVVGVRRDYDAKKTEAVQLEESIARLKGQRQLLAVQQAKLRQMVRKQSEQLQEVDRKLAQATLLMQQTQLKKDVYGNLKDTIKNDILVLKKRYFDKDVQLLRESTRLKTLRTQHEYKVKLGGRCRQLAKTLQHSVEVTRNQRYSKISDFYEVLDKKKQNQSYMQAKLKQIQLTMESAIHQKFPEQKQWAKLLHTHLTIKNILKSKMSRLMAKYQPVQFAYHRMRKASSIGNSAELVDRFLDREQRYGGLLQAIAEKQRQLQQIKGEKQELVKEHLRLKLTNDQGHSGDKTRKQGKLQGKGQLLSNLGQKILKNSKQEQAMYQWGVKFLAAFKDLGSRDQVIKMYPKANTRQLLIEILQQVKGFLNQQCQQQRFSSKVQSIFLTLSPDKTTLGSQFSSKNTRIKSMTTLEPDAGAQDKDLAYDDLSETDFLQHNRRAIKKNDLQLRRFRIKTRHV